MTKKTLIIWGAVLSLCLIIFFGIHYAYRLPEGAAQVKTGQVVTMPSGKTIDVSGEWYIGGIKTPDFQPGVYSVRMNVPLSEPHVGAESREDYILVFPSVDGNALRVFFNGHYIGSQGDIAQGNSNIWYAAKFFTVPAAIVSAENTIAAEIRGVYEAGISRLPYLIQKSESPYSLSWLSFSTRGLVVILAGAIIILGFILIFMGFGMYPQNNSRLILGIACFLTALFLTDFMNLEYLPVSLLAFKKMVVIARHLAAITFFIGFLKLLEHPSDIFIRIFVVIQIACSAILLYPSEVHLLKQFYTVTYLTILPLPLYLLYFLFHKRLQKKEYSILLAGVIFAMLTAIRDVAIPLINPGALYFSHFGFMILIISAAWFIVNDDIQHFRLLIQEKTRSEQYRHESLHDPLTGAYNRSMLEQAQRDLPSDFSLILIDIDNLKEINDSYGHLAGDYALRNLVSRIQNLIRHDDLTIRYGGDEFLVILPHCPSERLASIVENFAAEFSRSEVALQDGQIFTYSVSLGSMCVMSSNRSCSDSFEDALVRADEKMYENKRLKKSNSRIALDQA